MTNIVNTLREMWCGYCGKFIKGDYAQLEEHLTACEVECCNKRYRK